MSASLTPGLLAAALALAAGCAWARSGEPAAGSEVRLAVGESATVAGLALTFAEVVADSRCPTGVQCMWMGEVRVAVEVVVAAGSGEPSRVELTLGPEPATAVAPVDGRQLRLLAVDPYPEAGKTIAPAEYRATLAVEPGRGGEK